VRAATTGEERWWSISGRPIHDQFNNFVGFRGSGSDLTERRRSQEHASRLAHYDSLTGLANRFQMSQTLEKILNAQREEQRSCAVFLLDLDRFKQVNDTLGHPAGDALLKQVAQRLERTVDDAGRVGRLGGDEFEVILPGARRHEDLAQLASRIIESLSQPYSIEGQRVVIGASVGIARAPGDGVTSEALIRNADLALYAAKDAGRGRYHFYDPSLHSDAEERHQLEQDLRDAIADGGFELYYQPVVHTTTEKITGFEALLRWNHPRLGPLSPAKFVPIAEDAGLIAQIGEWALRTACKDLARWPETVRAAVNVSALQFANPALPAIVTSALAEAQVMPARLELEITESVFLNDDCATEAMFAALKRVGVRLALDDFGTGYSSLGYLKKAPFDKIKIDQSFVRGATVDGSRNGAIISSIVSLAEALGMETTAEGVETLDELDLVRLLGCSHIQGYIYEKPLSAQAAGERLACGLAAIASGPRSARAPRQKMLRKVMLEHAGEKYNGTIRNISTTGAMVEGLWNVPPETVFSLHMAKDYVISATARWSKDDRMGVEFEQPLEMAADGRISVLPPRPDRTGADSIVLRKTG
jgi:diguanylate cyclase (GGDEF)-like protein